MGGRTNVSANRVERQPLWRTRPLRSDNAAATRHHPRTRRHRSPCGVGTAPGPFGVPAVAIPTPAATILVPDRGGGMDVALLLQTGWLLPALALLVALDAPFPVLPSEPLLMTASAVAIGAQDVPMAMGLLAAAFAGSVAGDHLMFVLGRTSRRLGRPGASRVARWVRRNIANRPAVTIV